MRDVFGMNPAWLIGLVLLSLIGFAKDSHAEEHVRDESGLTEEMRRTSVVNGHCEMRGWPVAERIGSVGLTVDGSLVSIRADIELIPVNNWFLGDGAHLRREHVKVWIDWDKDEQFGKGKGGGDDEEMSECVMEQSRALPEHDRDEDGKFMISFSQSSDIPEWYEGGDTWARVALNFNAPIGSSCGSLGFGDVLDVPLEIPDVSPVLEGLYIDDPGNQGNVVPKKPGDWVTMAHLLSYDGHAPRRVTLVVEVPDNWECGCWQKYDDSGKRDGGDGGLLCGGREIRIENIALRGAARVELHMRIPEDAAQEEVCVSSRLLPDGEQLGEALTADLLIGDDYDVALERMYVDDAPEAVGPRRVIVNKIGDDLIEIIHVLSNNGGTARITLTTWTDADWKFEKCYRTTSESDSSGTRKYSEVPLGKYTDEGNGTHRISEAEIPPGKVRVRTRFHIPETASPGDVSVSSEVSSDSGNILVADNIRIAEKDDISAVIVTNRDNLYEIYDEQEVTELLETLFSVADEDITSGGAEAVIYYADWYDEIDWGDNEDCKPLIGNWDNQKCMSVYGSNRKCRELGVIGRYERDYSLNCTEEDLGEPSVPVNKVEWDEACGPYEGSDDEETPLGKVCREFPPSEDDMEVPDPDNSVAKALGCRVKEWMRRLNPEYLLIVGGDEVLPFHRLYEPDYHTGAGWLNNWTPAVLYMGHYFSDVFHYADHEIKTVDRHNTTDNKFSYPAIRDEKIDVSCGRIVGASVGDMLSLINGGLKGPQGADNIVLASTADGVVKHMDELLPAVGSGIRVNGMSREDSPLKDYVSVCEKERSQACHWNGKPDNWLIESDVWGCSDLIGAINGQNPKYVLEGSHTYPLYFGVSEGDGDRITPCDMRSHSMCLKDPTTECGMEDGGWTCPLDQGCAFKIWGSVCRNDPTVPCVRDGGWTCPLDGGCAPETWNKMCSDDPTTACVIEDGRWTCPHDKGCGPKTWTWGQRASHGCTTHDLDSGLRDEGHFVAMLGCYAAAIEERSDDHTSSLAYEFIHKGACGYFGSTVLVYADHEGLRHPVFGAKLYNLFVGNLMNPDADDPNATTVGNAFRKALNDHRKILREKPDADADADADYWGGADQRYNRAPSEYKHHRTPTQFHLYGIPWMRTNLPYPPPASGQEGRRSSDTKKARSLRETVPRRVKGLTTVRSGTRSGGTFSKMFTFSVPTHSVTRQGSFDLVEIPGAETDITDYLPVLPYLMATLMLPRDASVLSVRLTGGATESLGRLNIPTYLLIPGPDAPPSFTDVMYVTGLYPEANCTHRVFQGRDDTEVITYFVPVRHNVDTKETTLWTEATVEVQYQVDECIFISALRTDKGEYRTTEPIVVTATLQNVGDEDVDGLTAVASLKRGGQFHRTAQVPVPPVPAGGGREVTVSVDNGVNSGVYALVFEVRDEGDTPMDSMTEKGLFVSSGRTDIEISGESLAPGDPLDLTVTYGNYHEHQVAASIIFGIYDETGDMVMSVPGSPTEISASSSADITFHIFTGNLAPGKYEAMGGAEVDGEMRPSQSHHFVIREPGDLDCDFLVTLADALIALRLSASEDAPPEFCPGDVDGDGRVGLAEAVHVLQKVAAPE